MTDRQPTIGDNSSKMLPPEAQAIADSCDAAREWLRKHPKLTCLDDANAARNYGDHIAALRKLAEAARVAEKKPHDEAAKKVQEKWKPHIDLADKAAASLKDMADAWVKGENARIAREAAEAERKAREEAEAAHKAELARVRAEAELAGGDELDVIVAQSDLPVVVVEPVQVERVMIGGVYGRRTAGKTVITYVVEDWQAVIAALSSNEKLRECVQLIVNAQGKAGHILPGVRKVES